MRPLLDGSTVLITGASAGFGAEFARQLAGKAATLILVARRHDRLKALGAELGQLQPSLNVHLRPVDLSKETEVDGLVEWLEKEDLLPDVVINNAGLGDHGPFADSDWEKVRSMLEVNIAALTKLTHRLLPHLLEQNHGGILNVSSVASMVPVPCMGVYAATKAYVSSLTESIRAEVSGSDVRVSAVCPGPVDTEFSSVARRPGSSDVDASPDILKIPASRVVAEGLAGLEKNRARVIPGLLVACLLCFTAALPLLLVRPILAMGARERLNDFETS